MSTTSINFIGKFLAVPEDARPIWSLTFSELLPLPTFDVSEELVLKFAQIYNSSDAFDLGTPPVFGPTPTYATETIRNIVGTVARLVHQSARERAEAVHDIWAHTYICWRLAGKASDRDSLLVPFDALPPFEKKKRYFAAELVPLIVASRGAEDERIYACAALDLAAYHVAYQIVQDVHDDVPDPHELVEINDALHMSPSTLF